MHKQVFSSHGRFKVLLIILPATEDACFDATLVDQNNNNFFLNKSV